MEEGFAGITEKLAMSNDRLMGIRKNTMLMNEYLDMMYDLVSNRFDSLIEGIEGDSLNRLEQNREARKQQQTLSNMIGHVTESLDKGIEQRKEIIDGQDQQETSLAALGLLGGSIAFALGGLKGVIAGYVESFKALLATVRSVGSIITRAIGSLRNVLSLGTLALRVRFDAINRVFMGFEKVGSRIISSFTNFANRLKGVLAATGALGRAALMAPINAFFSSISRVNSVFGNAATQVSRLGASFAKTFSAAIGIFRSAISLVVQPIRAAAASTGKIGQLLGKIGGFFRNLLGSVGKVAGVVSKIFAPLNFIFVAFKTIQGTIQGFKEGGVLGGLQGALSGFFKALVGVPLDFIKGAVSWILGLFGMDKIAGFLESFSFSDLIGSIIAAPFKALEAIRDFIGEKINGFIGSLTGFLPDWIKNSLGIGDSDGTPSSSATDTTSRRESRSQVQTPTETRETVSASRRGRRGSVDIPEYEITRPDSLGESMASSQELEMAQREQVAIGSMGGNQSGGGVAMADNSTTNMISQPTINNNPLPNPSRRPDTARDLYYRNPYNADF